MKWQTENNANSNSATSIETAEWFRQGGPVKHKFDDEVRVRVTHDHDIHIEDVEELVDKVVEGAVIIIAVFTASHVIRRLVK